MSRFYEALLRAAKERPKSGDRTHSSIPDQDGESFLATIESLSSTSTKSSGSKLEVPSSEDLPTVEHIPTPSPVSSRQAVRPEGSRSPNSFRHISLQFREEFRLIFHTDPHGLPAEQFRLLRRTLSQEFRKGAVLLITSPGVGDGKTLTSLNLCACLADSGDPTLLVEADFRRPTARNLLTSAMKPPGIEDAWAGKVEPGEAVRSVEELSLHAAIVAKIPDDPSRLIHGAGVKQFLAWAREHFRWVVLDAPPVLPAADATELSPLADAVLLVIRAQSTPRVLSRRAFEMLGKSLYGVIFNEATVDSTPHYGYLSRYYGASRTKEIVPVRTELGSKEK